jgi:dihydroxy-acid dehydratase
VAEQHRRAGGADGAHAAHHRPHPDAGAFRNALRVLLAIGGSTNGIVHLTAIAGRLGIEIDLERVRPDRPQPRCWSTSSRRAITTWRTSTPPAAWHLLRELRPLLTSSA